MRVRRAVVTGGAGFLVSHLCHRLLQEGYEVICLDDFLTGAPTNVAHLLEHRRFRLVRADVTDYVHVSGQVDAVLHFALSGFADRLPTVTAATLQVGSIGTLHAQGWPRKRVRASCSLRRRSHTATHRSIRNLRRTGANVNPVGPRGVYDEAKRFAEALTMAYRRRVA